MRSIKSPVAIAAFLLLALGAIGCSNENGAAGSSVGTSAEAYELRAEENLVPPMDSANAAVPDHTMADSTRAHSGE